MSMYYKEKAFILECLGSPGFRGLFDVMVTNVQPLKWNGYKIASYFNAGVPGFNALEFLAKKSMLVERTFRFPRNPIHQAALYFWLQRKFAKEGWINCDPESPPDESPQGDDDSSYRQWSLFFLMYLDSLSWRFPDGFKNEHELWDEEQKAPRVKYIFGEICRQLCGVRSDDARIFRERTATEEELRYLCSHCKKACWADKFNRAEKHPALVLALSFSINRFASFTIEFEHKSDIEALKADYLYGLVDRATNRKVFVPRDEWEARSVFFILAQWLFLSDRRAAVPSLEEHILAILYLRFYRQGPDAYFKRGSASSMWEAIPYEKKEDVAAHYRRLLADTRNRAAVSWPDAKISNCPEIENGEVFDEIFHDLVRANDLQRLDMLLKDGAASAQCWDTELLRAASHSREMYLFLQKHHIERLKGKEMP